MTRKRSVRTRATPSQLGLELEPRQSAAIVRRATDAIVSHETTARERLSLWAAIVKRPSELVNDRLVRDKQGRPRSVWSAIRMMSHTEWNRLALDGFGLSRERDRAQLVVDCVLWETTETNRVEVVRQSGQVVRWIVWIDPKGSFKVVVYP